MYDTSRVMNTVLSVYTLLFNTVSLSHTGNWGNRFKETHGTKRSVAFFNQHPLLIFIRDNIKASLKYLYETQKEPVRFKVCFDIPIVQPCRNMTNVCIP